MEDYFLEFHFFSGSNEYWFPMMVTQKTSEEARGINDSVKKGLEEQFQKVEAKGSMVYIKGLSSNYIDGYVRNNYRGKIQSITINEWKITEAEFQNSIEFENIESKCQGDDSLTIANVEERIFQIVRVPTWPLVDYVEAFVINIYQQSS